MSRNTVCQGGRRKHTVVWLGGQQRRTAFMPLDLSTVVLGIGINIDKRKIIEFRSEIADTARRVPTDVRD